MGAVITHYTFEPCQTSTLRAHISDLVENNRAEFGYDAYAGCMNRHFAIEIRAHEVHGSIQAALEAHSDLEKETGVAVRFILDADTDDRAVQTQIGQLRTDATRAIASHIQGIRSGKSRFRGCKACGSSISTRHLRAAYGGLHELSCPICRDTGFLKTAGLVRILDGVEAKVLAAQQVLDRAQADRVRIAQRTPDALPWVVIACCRS